MEPTDQPPSPKQDRHYTPQQLVDLHMNDFETYAKFVMESTNIDSLSAAERAFFGYAPSSPTSEQTPGQNTTLTPPTPSHAENVTSPLQNDHQLSIQTEDNTIDLTGDVEDLEADESNQDNGEAEDFDEGGFPDDFFGDAALTSEADHAAALHFLQENPLQSILGDYPVESVTTTSKQAVGQGDADEAAGEDVMEVEEDAEQGGEQEDDEGNDATAPQVAWDPQITTSAQANAYLAAHRIVRSVRPANDDFAREQPNLAAHARSIMNAIANPPPKGSSKTTWTEIQRNDYDTYQEGGYADVKKAFATGRGQKKTQSNCVLLVDRALALHTATITITNANQRINRELIFSQRIRHIILAMQIKRTANSVCLGAAPAIDSLIQDPQAVLTDRNNSVKNNSHKAVKIKAYGKRQKAPKTPKASKAKKAKVTHADATSNPTTQTSNNPMAAAYPPLASSSNAPTKLHTSAAQQHPPPGRDSFLLPQNSATGNGVSRAGTKRPWEATHDLLNPTIQPARRVRPTPATAMGSSSSHQGFGTTAATQYQPLNGAQEEPGQRSQLGNGMQPDYVAAPGYAMPPEYAMPIATPRFLRREHGRRNTQRQGLNPQQEPYTAPIATGGLSGAAYGTTMGVQTRPEAVQTGTRQMGNGEQPNPDRDAPPARDSQLDDQIFGSDSIFTRYLNGDRNGGNGGSSGFSS